MYKPWLKLDPNNIKDRWWLYTSIVNTALAAKNKTEDEILCHFIIEDHYMNNKFYRLSTWYKNDPNRYLSIVYDINWAFDKSLNEIKEGDIITKEKLNFKARHCIFKKDKCIILERIFN